MALGTSKPRNWGIESQLAALALVCARRNVSWTIRTEGPAGDLYLYLAPSRNGLTLGYASFARLVNVGRGRWHAESILDGRIVAKGVSKRDVIRATIEATWH